MLIRHGHGWAIPERDATDEAVYLDRRRFLARAGLAGAGALAARCMGRPGEGLRGAEAVEAARQSLATTYNNCYEFRNDKQRVPAEAAKLTLRPWTVEIAGRVERPRTFWNDLQPLEYDLVSNVDPGVPHPRWSQATERMLGTDERRPTLPYNGYADQVAHLYQLS